MKIWLYIAVMALVTYLIRMLPLVLIRRKIRNRFLRSFLYYVPYVTLTAMTFPAILYAVTTPWVGAAALVTGVILAMRGKSLLTVAIACSGIVLVAQCLIIYVF